MAALQRSDPGSWYAIPLPAHGGYGVGLITQANATHSHLVGYFFGPLRYSIPAVDDLAHYRPKDAILVAVFGLGSGQWTFLGALPGWDSAVWPMPVFGRVVDPPGIGIRVEYPDDDPAGIPRETKISIHEARGLPVSSYLGHGAVEAMLANRLKQDESQSSNAGLAYSSGERAIPRKDQLSYANVTQNAHFRSEKEALHGQQMLEQAGYSVERAMHTDPSSTQVYWSIYAHQEMPYNDQEQLDRSCREVEQIVRASGGVYDGFEREV